MNNKWKTTKTIKEGNVHIMLHDYVYSRDRSPYYAEIVDKNHIRFTEAFNTIIAVIVDIQAYFGEWIIDYTVYDEGKVIDHKKITNPSAETVELIAVIFDRLTIDRRVLYSDDDYIIAISAENLTKPPMLVVRNRHRELLGTFNINNLIDAKTVDDIAGNASLLLKQFVYQWSSQSAVNGEIGNYFISNARRAFLTADWFILQQVNNARFLPHEIE